MYTQVSRSTPLPDGKTRVTTEIRDPQRNLVAVESAVFREDRLELQRYSDFQLNEEHELRVMGDRAYFTTRPLFGAGKIEDNEEAAGPDFVSGPVLEAFFKKHWPELIEGKSIAFDLAVPSKRATYGFEVSVRGSDTFGKREAVLLELKPTGILTSLSIRPIQVIVDRQDQRLLKWTGRTALHVEKEGELAPFDAEIVFR